MRWFISAVVVALGVGVGAYPGSKDPGLRYEDPGLRSRGDLAQETALSPVDLARRVQAHYDSVHDFEADFTLSARGAYARKPLPEQRGRVQLKKPGRINVTYSTSKDHQWADGVQFFQYDGAAKAVTISPLRMDQLSASILFLMNRADLLRDFTPALAPDQPADQWRLTLTPKRPDPEVKTLTLAVDRTTSRLMGLITVDAQDTTTTFQFQNLKENVGLADAVFLKQHYPDGTQIIR